MNGGAAEDIQRTARFCSFGVLNWTFFAGNLAIVYWCSGCRLRVFLLDMFVLAMCLVSCLVLLKSGPQ